MDFQTLARRDLQALCKRNKIPANMTNLAMAEALKSLEFVEGVDDVMQSSQSGTAQPSTESFEMAEVTSQTAGRSTRRANIPKPAPESVNPTTRTRRTTRKTQAKDVDALETPAPMSQTSRKNAQTASACLNMDSQLMECADVDTNAKDSLLTPAPVGATTTRRRRVGVSAAKSVQNTRRSGRLAVKTSVEKTSNDASQDESEVIPLGKEESEVVSDQNDAAVVEEIKMGSYAEDEAKLDKEKCDYEEEMPLNVSNEVQQDNGSQDVSISVIEIAAEKGIEELKPEGSSEVEEMPLNVSNEVQQDNGSRDVCMSEIEIAAEKGFEDYKPKGSSEVEEMPLNVSNEVQQNNGSQDVFACEIEIEVEKSVEEPKPEESSEVEEMPLNVSNDVQQNNGSQDECISEIEIAVEKSVEEPKPEESSEVEQDFVDNVLESRDNIVADGNTGFNDEIKEELDDSMIMDGGFRDVTDLNVAFVQTTKEADSEYVDSLDITVQFNENEANMVESLQLEEIEKPADLVQSDEPFADLSKKLPESDFDGLKEDEPTEMEILHLVEESKKSAEPVPLNEECAVGVEGLVDPLEIVQPVHLSPSKDSATVTKKMAVVSENIETETKLVVMSDDVNMAEKSVDGGYNAMSMRQLKKMLKEMDINKKPSKNENASKAMPRTALQVISDNQMVVDEAQK